MEAVLALQHYAGERVSVTVLTPSDRFTYRPASVGEPFNRPLAPSYDLEDVLAGTDASCRIGELASVDADARRAYAASGDVLAYDALLLATGARLSDSLPNAMTLNPDLLDEQPHGLVQDVEGGYVSSIAFVVPDARECAVHPGGRVTSAVLWGGPKPLYLDARAAGDAGTYSRAGTEPMWDPPSKIPARFLAPRLEMIERTRTASR